MTPPLSVPWAVVLRVPHPLVFKGAGFDLVLLSRKPKKNAPDW
jgi:hypothetical protein